MNRGLVVATTLAAIVIATPAPAHAYEFWLRSQTVGQAYALRSYRLVGPDLFHGRRRYTQSLALRIWDVGDLAAARRRERRPDDGLLVSWHSYLRIEHDFGDYSMGRLAISQNVRRDALDVIPELSESIAALDLLYGYVEVAGIAERATLQLGRVLVDDGWGTSGIDGARVRVELPAPLAIEAVGGLRVRASSVLGLAAYELDGTSGAGCREYVEGTAPGTGTWKLIDRDRQIENTRLSSDYEYCPQREVRQPSIGITVATSRLRAWGAELGYRRTWSRTVGLIGDVDRLDTPDVGLYPDEFGQAPSTGINEERLHARAYGRVKRGDTTLRPFASARVSLLHAALDRADAGMRVEHGRHGLEPAVEYFFPTFDGDSIFNVFSIEPTSDARLGYTYDGKLRGTANAWVRRYAHVGGTSSWTGGVDASAEYMPLPRLRTRATALYDDGYGGRRIGASGEGGWQARRDLWLRARGIVLGVAPDDAAAQQRRYVTSSGVASLTFQLGDAAALHAIVETNYDAIHDLQTRAIAVLDLAFSPEP